MGFVKYSGEAFGNVHCAVGFGEVMGEPAVQVYILSEDEKTHHVVWTLSGYEELKYFKEGFENMMAEALAEADRKMRGGQ